MSSNEEHDSQRDLDALGKSIGVTAGEDQPLPRREAPGLLRFLPPLVRDAWEKGATFQMDNATGDLLMAGFYKIGPLRLSLNDEGIVAHEGAEKKTPILSFSDLVDINYRYWCRVNRPKGSYIHPERPWLDAFRERGMVTKTVIYIPAENIASD